MNFCWKKRCYSENSPGMKIYIIIKIFGFLDIFYIQYFFYIIRLNISYTYVDSYDVIYSVSLLKTTVLRRTTQYSCLNSCYTV